MSSAAVSGALSPRSRTCISESNRRGIANSIQTSIDSLVGGLGAQHWRGEAGGRGVDVLSRAVAELPRPKAPGE